MYYEDKEMQDIMKKYYQIKRNLIISILFLIQHNYILSRQVVYKKAFDISRKGSHQVVRHQSSDTTVLILQITGYFYFLSYSFKY